MPPYLPQRQQVAIKLEAVEGTAETLADADVIAPVFAPEWVPSGEADVREIVQPSFSRVAQVIGERSAVIRFTTEVKGSGTAGTAPPNLSVPLQASGWGETIVTSTSVTYAPISVNISSATVELREGAADATVKIKKIVGARGTVSFEVVKGQIMRATFEFTGRYIEPTEGSFLTAPSLSPLPVAALNISFSFQGETALKAQNITLDMGNNISMRNDVNEASGNFSAAFVGRTPVGSIDPEQEDIATVNFFSNWTSNTEGVLSFVIGTVAGNITTVNAPKAQIVSIAEADRDGIRTEGIDLSLNESAAAGDDELTLAFT